MTDKTNTEVKVTVLETLTKALKIAGKASDLKVVTERLTKLDLELDEEYHAKCRLSRASVLRGGRLRAIGSW